MIVSDPVDFLDLPGVGGHSPPAVHDQQDGRGRVHHFPLLVRPGYVPGTVHLQLGVPVLQRGLLRPHRHRSRMCPDCSLLRFLLPLHHQRLANVTALSITR